MTHNQGVAGSSPAGPTQTSPNGEVFYYICIMIFKKKICDSEKNKAVYMWNMNPGEKSSIPFKNILKNNQFFNEIIIGPKEVDDLVFQMNDKRLLELWRRTPWWIVKADLGRLLFVYLNGGFYFDVDCRVKKNFLDKINSNVVLFVEKRLNSVNKLGPRENKSKIRELRIANYAFGAGIKKHPFLKEVINECINRLSQILNEAQGDVTDLDIVWICGPDVVTSVYHDFKDSYKDILLLDKDNLKHQSFGGWRSE